MVLHESFLQEVQSSSGTQDTRTRSPPRHDPFEPFDEKTRISIVKDIFFYKYLAHSSTQLELSSFDDVSLEDHAS